mgnify:CR=1 FL=1
MKTIKNKSTRTFGVEIEFTSSNRLSTINNKLNAALASINETRDPSNYINVYHESYNHNTRNHWKLVTDSSCGYELVSPVLRGQEGMNELNIIVNALDSIPTVKVNKSCGIHVHVGIQDATAKKVANLVKYYAKNESIIDSVMPNSRRSNNNMYCKPVMTYNASNIKRLNKLVKQNDAEGLPTQISAIANFLGNRYNKINLHSFRRYRTVEFRQHSGTVDSKKITTWVAFCLNTVDKVFKMKAVQFAPSVNHQDVFIDVFGVKQNRKVMKHFESRALHFGFNIFSGSFDKGASLRRF